MSPKLDDRSLDDDMEEDWRLLRGDGAPCLKVTVRKDPYEHGEECWFVALTGLPVVLASPCLKRESALRIEKDINAVLVADAVVEALKAEVAKLKAQIAKLTVNEMTAQLQAKVDNRFDGLMCTCGHEGKGHTLTPLVDGSCCTSSRCTCKRFQQAPLMREMMCTGCGLVDTDDDSRKECSTYGTSGHHFVEREFYLVDNIRLVEKEAPSSEGIRQDIARNAPSQVPAPPVPTNLPFIPTDPNMRWKTASTPSDAFQDLLDNI